MDQINYYNLPLFAIEQLLNFKDFCGNNLQNRDNIKFKWNNGFIRIDAIIGDYFFEVYKIEADSAGALVLYYKMIPQNAQKVKLLETFSNLESMLALVKAWLVLIDRYDDLLGQLSTDNFEIFEEQFLHEFGDNPNSSPTYLTYDQQIMLEAVIDRFVEALEVEESPNKILIKDDFIRLKKNLPHYDVDKIKKKMANVFAKMRKHSISFLKEMFTETKKHIIKQILDGTLNGPIESLLP
jgi:hypothetical protein